MKSNTARYGRAGFTLIEVLVTLILLALLAAAVFPVITQQVEEGDPVRAANDLANVRTGLELFGLNVRPTAPGDLEDLANAVSHAGTGAGADSSASATEFTSGDSLKWNGPYIDASIPTSSAATDTVFQTGFGGRVLNEIFLYDIDGSTGGTPVASTGALTAAQKNASEFVAVQVARLDSTQFEQINDLIDGTGEADGKGANGSMYIGKFRCPGSSTTACDGSASTAYYLAVPYKK